MKLSDVDMNQPAVPESVTDDSVFQALVVREVRKHLEKLTPNDVRWIYGFHAGLDKARRNAVDTLSMFFTGFPLAELASRALTGEAGRVEEWRRIEKGEGHVGNGKDLFP